MRLTRQVWKEYSGQTYKKDDVQPDACKIENTKNESFVGLISLLRVRITVKRISMTGDVIQTIDMLVKRDFTRSWICICIAQIENEALARMLTKAVTEVSTRKK